MPDTSKKILIIEDEKPMAMALELKLSRSGFKTRTVFTGREGLDVLGKEKFDLIVLDLVMPEMDGFDVLREIKNRKIEAPVLVVTNLSQEEDIQRAKELGAVDYFIKSDTPIIRLVEHIQKILNKE